MSMTGIKKAFSIFQRDEESVDEEQLVGIVQSRTKSSESIQQEYHRQWFTNIAMRRGLQYIQTQTGSGVVVMPPESNERVRIVINHMQGIHQTRVAKLIKDMPKLEVVPATSQDEDKDLARKGTKLLSWLWQNEGMVDKIMDTAGWCVDTGNCFAYVYWDADKGTDIPTYKRHEGDITENMPYNVDEEGFILDEEGQRVADDLTTGDVAVDLIDPFCVINDGTHDNMQDSNWVIMTQAMSLKDIKLKWKDRGGEVKSEKDLSTRAYWQRRLMTMVGNQHTYFTPESKQFEDMAVVYTMFERATPKNPKGRMVVVANGVLLEAGNMPFKHGQYPLIKFSDIEVSGSFWHVGTMEQLIPIQKGLNRVWSQIIENGNNLGNIKAWVTKGHGLTQEAYDDTGFEVLEVNEGHSVNQMQPASLPSHVVNQIDWYGKAFEDVSGQHEVSNAKVPAGVKSGRAIIALQEQDDTRLAPTKMRFYRAIEEIGYQALQLYGEFQTEDREYQIVGSSAFDIDDFKITESEIQSMKKDVRVQTENIIAAHKRLQQENVMDMYDKGLFGDGANPDVRKKVLELMEFGNVADLFDEVDLDVSMARQENQNFINMENLQTVDNPNFDPAAQPPEPPKVLSQPAYDFEDHEAHINVHNKLRKSPRYRQMSEQMRKGVDLHVQIHKDFLSGSGESEEQQQPTPEAMPPAGAPPMGAMPPPPAGAMPPPMGAAPPPPPMPPAPTGVPTGGPPPPAPIPPQG